MKNEYISPFLENVERISCLQFSKTHEHDRITKLRFFSANRSLKVQDFWLALTDYADIKG